MSRRVDCAGLQVSEELHQLISNEICPDLKIESENFWKGVATIFEKYTPQNLALLKRRVDLQQQIDSWHKTNRNSFDPAQYKKFLNDIGYLVPVGADFSICPANVDVEISSQAGPQLVVPITNARFALNAVNARWGSLYDALYANDVISEADGADKSGSYNPIRGQKVIEYGRNFLDYAIPIQDGSHHNVKSYSVVEGRLHIQMDSDIGLRLVREDQWVGFQGQREKPSSIIFKNNGLHIEIQVDNESDIGASDLAGVKDIILESAITTIMDCEDSVAAVDAQDKVSAYRNWMGLLKGTLNTTFTRGDKQITRKMNPDREFIGPGGKPFLIKGRSLMFVRNVGLLMTSPTILDGKGNELPEGIMDAIVTGLISLFDLQGSTKYKNSESGSMYIVKPKMHGPDEVKFCNNLFDAVEDLLGMSRNTIKVGIMDEERRTSVNLKECIRAVRERIVFINTGFLDRTGDEIHTSMHAGAVVPKGGIKNCAWIKGYENQNVDIGLQCGFKGKAQIGKGMWPIPDNMFDMMEQKIEHPKAGANTAWVPSPTASTIHAIHYHQVNVARQQELILKRAPTNVDELLELPLLGSLKLDSRQIQRELENNIQGILGYVVRWVEQGIGCSKVPDLNDVGLMEDRATLRISSQHIANWLEHGICTRNQVMDVLERMAEMVDRQNKYDASYKSMGPNYSSSQAFKAACDLIFKGSCQPNGYTEPLLHNYRRLVKACPLSAQGSS